MSDTTGSSPLGSLDERYERLDLIATGGMGEVWRGRDTVLGREVAIKVLKREFAQADDFRERFAAEARHAAGLHHHGIASVFDYGTLRDGTPILVMELVDGQPLSNLIRRGVPMPVEQARDLALLAAQALGVAHAAGVVHRDVKPANLLVTPQGRLKITDFGIARAMGAAALTATGQVLGTPHYLAPEQAEARGATPASDVYALGVVLYECLTGERPFDADTPVGIAMAHLRQPVPELPETVPAGIAEVTRRALAKDPADRYPDGAAFAAVLRDLPADGSLPAGGLAAMPPASATQVLSPDTAVPMAQTAVGLPPQDPEGPGAFDDFDEEPDDEARRGRGWPTWWPLAAAAAAALVLLVALVAASAFGDSDDPQAPETTASAPTPSAPRSSPSQASSEPSPRETPTPRSIDLDADDYVGRPVNEVRADLEDLGLRVQEKSEDNEDGDETEGTVAEIDPTGAVDRGDKITVRVWGAAASPEPEKTDSGELSDSSNGAPQRSVHGNKKK